MNESKAPYPNPFLWVPSSYLAMGLIYVTVGSLANVMFKNMGMDNTHVAFWSRIEPDRSLPPSKLDSGQLRN
jgi:PAT family beta-lactamase induction signal transducer AmpG